MFRWLFFCRLAGVLPSLDCQSPLLDPAERSGRRLVDHRMDEDEDDIYAPDGVHMQSQNGDTSTVLQGQTNIRPAQDEESGEEIEEEESDSVRRATTLFC